MAVQSAGSLVITKPQERSQTMNQKIDEYVHDISARFFPEDSERCEELGNVLDELVTRVMIEYRSLIESKEYKPEEIRHG